MRLMTVLRSHVTSFVERMEDPTKSVRLLILDMRKDLSAAHRRVSEAMAAHVKLTRQRDEHQAESKKWETRALQALQAGKENLAKIALTHKQEHDQYVTAFTDQVELQSQSVASMKKDLQLLQLKVNQAERKETLLVARANRTDTKMALQNSIDNPRAMEMFERMEKRILDREVAADIASNPNGVDDVWNEIDNLSSVEAELNRLKNQATMEVSN